LRQIIWIVILFFLCLLPSFIAKFRGHRNTGPIAVLNVFFLFAWIWIGWFVALFWFIALIWSCTSNTDKSKRKDLEMLANMMKGAR
jgi:threonine/homoserine/homoserine lactone efflux protein